MNRDDTTNCSSKREYSPEVATDPGISHQLHPVPSEQILATTGFGSSLVSPSSWLFAAPRALEPTKLCNNLSPTVTDWTKSIDCRRIVSPSSDQKGVILSLPMS